MSNTNYTQNVENIQQTTKKYWSYLYEIRHIPTGLLYVGSRANQSVLKKFEDCYTDNYLGSSSLEEGPFSEKDTKTNPQNYAKTILKVFYDELPKKAWKYEHGSNGLIMTYWNLYGRDKVLNEHCVLSDDSEVWSRAGQIHTQETKEKISSSLLNHEISIHTKNEISKKIKGAKWITNGIDKKYYIPKMHYEMYQFLDENPNWYFGLPKKTQEEKDKISLSTKTGMANPDVKNKVKMNNNRPRSKRGKQ